LPFTRRFPELATAFDIEPLNAADDGNKFLP